jgi:hypothetical protein
MIPYKIDGFRPRVFELSDPRGPNNVMDGWVRFILDLGGREHVMEVHARLVLESNMFDRDVEVYAPDLPPGVVVRADELQKAVRGVPLRLLEHGRRSGGIQERRRLQLRKQTLSMLVGSDQNAGPPIRIPKLPKLCPETRESPETLRNSRLSGPAR